MYDNVIVNAVPRRELGAFLAPAGCSMASDQVGIVIHDSCEGVGDRVEGNVCHVSFDDEVTPGNGVPMSPAQAKSVMDFAADAIGDMELGQLDGLDIVVSCKGGVCRSAAVAMALYLMLFGEERAKARWLESGRYLPNRHVFETCVGAVDDLRLAYDPAAWNDAFQSCAEKRIDALLR